MAIAIDSSAPPVDDTCHYSTCCQHCAEADAYHHLLALMVLIQRQAEVDERLCAMHSAYRSRMIARRHRG